MPRQPRPLRNVRIEDQLWQAAQARAEAEGKYLSEVIRELLQGWVDRPGTRRKA